MSPITQAVAWRFFVGLVLVEIPVATAYLTVTPTPPWQILLAGLLGGLAAAIEKYLAPQVADTLVTPSGSTLNAGYVVRAVTPLAPQGAPPQQGSPVPGPQTTPGSATQP